MTTEGDAPVSYVEAVAGMEEFGTTAKSLVRELLRANGIVVHTIDHRVKTKESATRKLSAPDSSYEGYPSLHDLLGLRVTCYFSDEVDRVAEIIEREFTVDPGKSVDKGKQLGPKEFGYRSVHRVARLGTERANLTEYARFESMCFEIQIRTVVQHAWAEIEHDLGYKLETTPEPMSRRFSMLAGVLELVDYEFMALRDGLAEYERNADKAAMSPVADNATTTAAPDMAVDQATLKAFLLLDPVFTSFDEELTASVNTKLRKGVDIGFLRHRLRQLHDLDLVSMTELRNVVEQWRKHVLDFAKRWIERPDSLRSRPKDSQQRAQTLEIGLPRGIGLFYLWIAMNADATSKGARVELPLRDWVAVSEVWAETVKEMGPPPVNPARFADGEDAPSE